LALPTATKVVRIERVRLANGVPVSFDETYLPQAIGEQIITNDLETQPIFSLLENKYDIPLHEADYRLEAVSASERVSAALEIAAGSPIFLIERTSYREGGQPIDYEKLHYRGDLVRFATTLTRRGGRAR
jgi:GntR family transcriptional regulator